MNSNFESTLVDRAKTVLNGGGRGSQQVIMKKISTRRNRRGIINLISYIARRRETDYRSGACVSVQLFGGIDQPLSSSAARMLIDADWGVLDEEENLSAKSRRLILDGKPDQAQKLQDIERLQYVQAIHLTWSFRKPQNEEISVEEFENVVSGGIAGCQLRGLMGERVIWAVHDEHRDRIHAHLIVHPEIHPGKRIRFTREYGHAMRQAFMECLRACGFDVSADFREDRADTRAKILRGEEPLRPSKSIGMTKRKTDPAKRTPMWFINQGLAYEKRRCAKFERRDRATLEIGGSLVNFLRASGQQVDVEGAGIMGNIRVATEALDIRLKQDANALRQRDQLQVLRKRFEKDRKARECELLPVEKSLKQKLARKRPVPPELQEILSLVSESFISPEVAVLSWAEMAGEGAYQNKKGTISFPNKSLANWHMRKNPLIFGDVTEKAIKLDNYSTLKKALRCAVINPVNQDFDFIRGYDDSAEAQARKVAEAFIDKQSADYDRIRLIKSLSQLSDQLEDHLGMDIRAEKIRKITERAASIAVGLAPKSSVRKNYTQNPELR
ncbi:MAG: hypothetical protein COB46_07720 [Rhodospirillaceae bacterium]|nr:MAG: hypothetical protein COB46_07720 [Rhodospirillaceae bacterium]